MSRKTYIFLTQRYKGAKAQRLMENEISYKVIIEKQKHIPVLYKGVMIREPYILDILMENKVIIEVKATEKE